MQLFWQIVASNALLVLVLAAGVALLGRIWRNPLCLHLLWIFVLLKLMTPPVATIPVAIPTPITIPARQVSLESESLAQDQPLAQPSPIDVAGPETTLIAAEPEPEVLASHRAVAETSASSLVVAPPVTEYPARPWPWLTILGWTWGLGVVLFASRYAYRILRFRRLLRHAQPATPAELAMAARIARRLGLGHVPEIRLLPVCVSPLVWSLGGRPRVYLPAALFERLDATAQEAILAHELAHVRRGDHWVRLLEMVMVTLFWWHPVVWWAARRLQELEDQCCDRVVVDLAPHGAKSYATALLDTLDFLCDRSVAAPLGATAAKSSVSLTRRIAMLRDHSWTARWTLGRLMLLLAVAAVPMTLAFGQKPPEAAEKAPQSVIERRPINKLAKDFPEKADLSTPESACAALARSFSRSDVSAILDLCWVKMMDADLAKDVEDTLKNDPNAPKNVDKTFLDAKIIEVLVCGDDCAAVTYKWDESIFGPGRGPYGAVVFGKINGTWKGLDCGIPDSRSLQDVVASVESKKEEILRRFSEVRDEVLKGHIPAVDEKHWPELTRELRKSATPPASVQPAGASEPSVVKTRVVNKLVEDFPEKTDLSTPETAAAAYERAWARLDAKAVWELGAYSFGPREIEETKRFMERDAKDIETYRQSLLGTEVIEVLTYHDDLAAAISKVRVSASAGHFAVTNPYSVRTFVRINGAWKNFGENRLPSVEGARKDFDGRKDNLWKGYVEVLDGIKKGKPATATEVTGGRLAQAAPIAPSGQPMVERREVNKLVADFPEKADLSTPESAAATYHRAVMNPDPKVMLDLSAWSYTPRDVEEIKRKMEANRDEIATMNDAYCNAEIIEVLTYRGDLAEVISKIKFAEGVGRNPYSARTFGRINGQWKNFGENRLASVEAARKDFDRIKDNLWKNYVEVLDGLKKGKPVRLEAGDLSTFPTQAIRAHSPGQPLGISVEKADLMGRIEWAFMHGGQNITARKSLEWGDIEKDKDGNRTLRYKFEATIWDKDVMIFNQVFAFDAKGNILNIEDVEGFPKKKVKKPVDVTTQAGMKDLVEDFFTKNFRDVTSRETIEWGDVEKAANGNASIRYKYRVKIWDKETKIMNQVFTFDPKGEFVSYKNVEGFPQDQ